MTIPRKKTSIEPLENIRNRAIEKAAEVYRKYQGFPLNKMRQAINAYDVVMKKAQEKNKFRIANPEGVKQ